MKHRSVYSTLQSCSRFKITLRRVCYDGVHVAAPCGCGDCCCWCDGVDRAAASAATATAAGVAATTCWGELLLLGVSLSTARQTPFATELPTSLTAVGDCRRSTATALSLPLPLPLPLPPVAVPVTARGGVLGAGPGAGMIGSGSLVVVVVLMAASNAASNRASSALLGPGPGPGPDPSLARFSPSSTTSPCSTLSDDPARSPGGAGCEGSNAYLHAYGECGAEM